METTQKAKLIQDLNQMVGDMQVKKYDEAFFVLDRVLRDLEEPKISEQQIVEVKDSIKLTKNTKGYNYEIRLVAKEGIDLLAQLDFVHTEMEARVKKWTK